ncbi:MAG: hypothetical protein WKH64_14835 [Chloroflexia bacterium]
MLCSADPQVHQEHIQHFLDLGFNEVYLQTSVATRRSFGEVAELKFADALVGSPS